VPEKLRGVRIRRSVAERGNLRLSDDVATRAFSRPEKHVDIPVNAGTSGGGLWPQTTDEPPTRSAGWWGGAKVVDPAEAAAATFGVDLLLGRSDREWIDFTPPSNEARRNGLGTLVSTGRIVGVL
jgi:hypothetical protein